MSNPFRPMKYLPWAELFQSAFVTIVITVVLDFLLWLALFEIATNTEFEIPLPQVLLPLIALLVPAAVSLGIGALAVVITERFFRQVMLRAGTLWALVGCVLVVLFLRGFLPVRSLLVGGIDYFSIVGITVGAFTYGRRYWRY
ncbi:MAG: peptide chain release factor 1 [Cyanobacteria bacterium J06614_10]